MKNTVKSNFFALLFLIILQTSSALYTQIFTQPLVFIPKNAHRDVLELLHENAEIPFLNEPWSTEKIVRNFGAWSIDQKLFDYIRSILQAGKTILELGSGWASGQFSKFYTLYSVEHDSRWLGKYDTNYIYAQIKNRWYDPEILKRELPNEYDLILVDGPTGSIGRSGFYTHLDLFKKDVPIIFDDIDRKPEYALMILVAQKLNRDVVIYQSSQTKKFGVLLNEKNIEIFDKKKYLRHLII